MAVPKGTEARTLAALAHLVGPHVRGNALDRSDLEAALAKLQADGGVRKSAEAALADAGIRLVGTLGEEVAGPSLESIVLTKKPQSTTRSAGTSASRDQTAEEPKDPLALGRRRLAADRAIRRPDKVILTADEEVGLTFLARPDGRPLPAGGLAQLEGEQRAAAEALVLHNLKLAHHVAKAYVGLGLEYEDLYASALPGLMRAVELFDPSAGFKFSTYATHWLRQAVTRAIANEGRAVRLPVHLWELVRKVVLTREKLTVDGRPPALRDLAAECAINMPKLVECLRLAPAVLSLDAPYGDDQFTLGDLIDAAVTARDDPEVWGVSADEIIPLLGYMNDREADVLRMRLGLAPYDEVHTLDDIGRTYNVTRERIRQIETKAKASLRELVVTEGLISRLPGDSTARARRKSGDPSSIDAESAA